MNLKVGQVWVNAAPGRETCVYVITGIGVDAVYVSYVSSSGRVREKATIQGDFHRKSMEEESFGWRMVYDMTDFGPAKGRTVWDHLQAEDPDGVGDDRADP